MNNGDVVQIIETRIVRNDCSMKAAHDRHRYVNDLNLDNLVIQECFGVEAKESPLDQPINWTLTAAEWFVVRCAIESEFSHAYEHGPVWERITGNIQLPSTNLTYKDVTGSE